MKRTIVLYSLAMAVVVLGLQWLDYQYTIRAFSFEIYIVLIAVLFAALGVWVGLRLATRTGSATFEQPNARAMDYLGISAREYEVLELLAHGCSNKEIAERLFVSPNTVKTHLAHLYDKLQVSRRTQAIRKAQTLEILP